MTDSTEGIDTFFTGLQEQLASPGGGAIKQERLAALEAARIRVRAALAGGVSRDLHERHASAMAALSAAIDVLQSAACRDDAAERTALFRP